MMRDSRQTPGRTARGPAGVLALGLVLAMTLAVGPMVVQAQGWGGDRPRDGGGAARDGGQDQAAAAARRATGGRVLDVRPADGSYRVRVLTPNGTVRSLRVDRQGRVDR